ncbi:MAG: hypothetical protein LKK55_02105 [Olsenella sp.]|nr:hypothetical protein [Olsenella sp.]
MLLGHAALAQAARVLVLDLEVVVGHVVVQARLVAGPAHALQVLVHVLDQLVGARVEVRQRAVDVVEAEVALAREAPARLEGAPLRGGLCDAVPHEQLEDAAGVVGEPARGAPPLEEAPDPEVAVEVRAGHGSPELDAPLGALVDLFRGRELDDHRSPGCPGPGVPALDLGLEMGDRVVVDILEGVGVADRLDGLGPGLAVRRAVALHDGQVDPPLYLRLPEMHGKRL